jgi:hypothetical protein
MLQTPLKFSPISKHVSFFYVLNMDFSYSSHVAIMTNTEVHTQHFVLVSHCFFIFLYQMLLNLFHYFYAITFILRPLKLFGLQFLIMFKLIFLYPAKNLTPAPFFTLSFLRRSATTSLRVVRVLYLRGTRVN